MKRILTIVILALFTQLTSFAQSPEKINYQAVIRDQNNAILSSQTIGYKIAVLQGSSSGSSVYEEEFTLTTSALGLINFAIGDGAVISGDFSQIDWGNGPFFIETSVDLNGGTSYSVLGTSQLLSVPYSLYSNAAQSADSALYSNEAYTAIYSDSAQYATDAGTALYADSSNHSTYSDTAVYALNVAGGSSSGDDYYFQAATGWSTQSISGTNYTEHVEFAQEILDPSNSYDPTTATFTAPQTGIYYFSTFVTIISYTSNPGGVFFGFLVNNATYPDPASVPTTVVSPGLYTAAETVVTVSGIIQLNQGDEVEVGVIGAADGEAFNMLYSGFSGYKIR